MKKLKCALAAIMMCVTACLCGACSPEEEQPAVTTTQNTQTFINIVAQIPDQVTVDYGYKIEAALLVYGYLNDSEKDNSDVSASKTRLDELKTKYDVVKAEADRQAEIEREDRLVSNFIREVDNLPDNVKLSNKETVEGLIERYAQLKEESKQKREVVAAYAKLLAAEARIAVLEEEARQEVVEATAEKFISSVKDLLDTIEEADDDDRDKAILDAGTTLKALLRDYDEFEDDVKAYAGVAEAKAQLDELNEVYTVLRDEADVEEFLALVKALPPVEQVTLESEGAISKAESHYNRTMSDKAKEDPDVIEAYKTLQQARAKYDELFEAAEKIKIQQFIDAANKVGTDIENVDISWFDVLDAASKAYTALSWDSQELPELQEAFNRWNDAQKVFDSKGYKRIPMTDPNILFSGHTINPLIVLQNEANMITPLLDFYQAKSLSEISSKVTVWLNVYKDGEYVGRGELAVTLLGHEIDASHIQNVLKGIPGLQSGGSFAFSLNFEDKNNTYIPSAKTNVSSASKVYTW